MDAVINNLQTVEDLDEFAELWGMQDDELVHLRRIEILCKKLYQHDPVTQEHLTPTRYV